MNDAFTDQAGDNVAIHQIEMKERGRDGYGELYDIRAATRDALVYVALE